MNIRTSTRLITLTATMIAVVAIAPAAQASSDGTFVLRRSAPPVVIDPHGTQARYNAQRVIFHRGGFLGVVKSTGAPSVPDRVDGIGSARGPQVVQAPGRVTDGGSSFDWSAAALSAGLLLAAVLLVVFTVSAVGGRRNGGIPLQS
jgi:hypothetical protein